MNLLEICERLGRARTFVEVAIEACTLAEEISGSTTCDVAMLGAAHAPTSGGHMLWLPLLSRRGTLGHLRCTRDEPLTGEVHRDLWCLATATSLRLAELGVTFPVDTDAPRLTPRQHDVAQLAARGLDNQEIADRLELSINTVKKHLKDVFLRLEIESRAELAYELVTAERQDLSPSGVTRIGRFVIYR